MRPHRTLSSGRRTPPTRIRAYNPFIFNTIAAAVAAIDRPVLVGAVLQDPVRNAGQLWLPGKGPVATYIKRQAGAVRRGHPVPRTAGQVHLAAVSLQPVNFTPGHRPVVFRIGKIRLGDVICYEVGFDGLVSSEVAAGANLLAVQTNDADFELDGQTSETLQQLDMARIRAIEHNRAVVVASTTGISAIIAPDGKLLASTGPGGRPRSRRGCRCAARPRWPTALGGWPEAVIAWATLAALAWAIGQEFRRRRDRGGAGRRARRPATRPAARTIET